VEPIWKNHWPAWVDEPSIRIPGETLPEILARHARRVPHRPAIVFYGRGVSFAELDSAVDSFAAWLRRRGIGPGDRVAICLENCPQFAIAYFGALRAGAVCVCLDSMHRGVELEHELNESGARALCTSDQAYPVVEPIRPRTKLEAVAVTAYRDFLPLGPALLPPESFLETEGPFDDTERLAKILHTERGLDRPVSRAPEDTALLQYTSDTTGRSEAAEITHRNLVVNCEIQRLYVGSSDEDVALGVLPWFRITGMECQMNMMAYTGATLVAIGRFDLMTVLRAVEMYRCTVTTLIATANAAIVNFPGTRDFDLSSLRTCFSRGAPVPAEIARRWEAITGHELIESYGSSETTATTHINPPHRPKHGTVGVPLPLTDARVVSRDDAAAELKIGEPGDIAVRGPQVAKGYWRNPDATRAAFREGWFLTGDVGFVDDEGYFTIVERKKVLRDEAGEAPQEGGTRC
jgi:acyl-CoA synthetase (AMP-forming)/AMP-acid ligase II